MATASIIENLTENTDCDRFADEVRRLHEAKQQNSDTGDAETASVTDQLKFFDLCRRAVEPALFQILTSIGATDKLLSLILRYIVTLDDFACSYKTLQFEPSLVQKVDTKLELRATLLSEGWPRSLAEINQALLNKICNQHQTLIAFRSLPYKTLEEEYLTQASITQRSILERVWLQDNKLRTSVKKYRLPLRIIDDFSERSIQQAEQINDKDVEDLIKLNRQNSFNMSSSTTNNSGWQTQRCDAFEANLKQFHKAEAKHQDVEYAKQIEEQQATLEKTAKLLEQAKANEKITTEQVRATLNDVKTRLKVNWQFSPEELNKPDALLDSVLKHIQQAQSHITATASASVFQSDEQLVAFASAGMALHGISFNDPKQVGQIARCPLILSPTCCSLRGPSINPVFHFHKFTEVESVNRFSDTIRNSGLTFALQLSASFGVASGNLEISRSSTEQTQNIRHIKKQSTALIQLEYAVLPQNSFRISRNTILLTSEACDAIKGITNPHKARQFLNDFGSHFNEGTQHLGGIFMHRITVEVDSETDTQLLENIVSKTWKGSLGAGYSGFGFGAVSVEHMTAKGETTGKEKASQQVNIKRAVECIGPFCQNIDLFQQTLKLEKTTWYIIDRGSMASFVPVWELIDPHSFPSHELRIEKAIKLLKEAWLNEFSGSHRDNLHPWIKAEIDRVVLRIDSVEDITLPPSLHRSDDTNQVGLELVTEKLNKELARRLGGESFTIDHLSDNVLKEQVAQSFLLITMCSLEHGSDLLPSMTRLSTIKRLLHQIANNTDVKKTAPVHNLLCCFLRIPRLHQLELEPDVMCFIRRGYDTTTKDHLHLHRDLKLDMDISVAMIHELPERLRNLLQDNSGGDLSALTSEVNSQIYRSLELSKSTVGQVLNDIQQVLEKYGWSSESNDFSQRLTEHSISTLIEEMVEVLDARPKFILQTSLDTDEPLPHVPTILSIQPQDIFYRQSDWILDRPLAPVSEPVKQLIDNLRHRLSIPSDAVSQPSSTSISTSTSLVQQLMQRRSKTIHVNNNTETSTENKETVYGVETQYDILINLLRHSDLLSQSELFRLLIERRTAVPLITPKPNSESNFASHNFDYHINALAFTTTTLQNDRKTLMSHDISLYRIAILSDRSSKESESVQLLKQVFGCRSLAPSFREKIKCIPDSKCIAELGVGFFPRISTDEKQMDTANIPQNEVLILHVIGDYPFLLDFILDFTNLFILEGSTNPTGRTKLLDIMKDQHELIVWRSAIKGQPPFLEEQRYLSLSSTLAEAIPHIRELTQNFMMHSTELDKERTSLNSFTHPSLYCVDKINWLADQSIDRQQDYVKLRSTDFKLQQLFMEEAQHIRRSSENKSNEAEQRAIQRDILSCREKRVELASSLTQHQLVKALLTMLKHPDDYFRITNLQRFIQRIDSESSAANRTCTAATERAFHVFIQNLKDSCARDEYCRMKRICESSTVGIEHIWREIAHIYSSRPAEYASYPRLAAQHLLDGFPLELVDGDAGMLEKKWIGAVFYHLNELIREKNAGKEISGRLLVISALGTQSSGKSTLLNLMFGTRLRVSTGACTRGVNMQLIRVENRSHCDYILILDTEGIRAPEYADSPKAAWHDNRLATFAILPADVTIVVISNEDDTHIREIIPIVMLAYQQSDMAANSCEGFKSKLFFVYTRIDMNDTEKVKSIAQSLFMELRTRARQLEHEEERTLSEDTVEKNTDVESELLQDFRFSPTTGDESDIRFIGKVRVKDHPPEDIPEYKYGFEVMKLVEYIHNRLNTTNWKARDLITFQTYLDTIWQCVETADFTLSFKTVLERWAYDDLQTVCSRLRSRLSKTCSKKYEHIEDDIVTQLAQKINDNDIDELIARYIGVFLAAVREEENKIQDAFNEQMKQKRWKPWYEATKISWEIFRKNQIDHFKSRIAQLITTRLTISIELIKCQKQIRLGITKLFQQKDSKELKNIVDDEEEQNREFSKVFTKIMSDAKEKQPRMDVETAISNVYESHHFEFQFSEIYKKRKQSGQSESLPKQSRSLWKRMRSHISCISGSKKEHFYNILCEDLFELLDQARTYSSYIPHDAIHLTEKCLREYALHKSKSEIIRAHQTVYAILAEDLTVKQENWEKKNRLPIRLSLVRDDLLHFYRNTMRGLNGMQILTSDLKTVFSKHSKLSFSYSTQKLVINNLHNESWITDSRLLLARADMELLKLIDTNNIPEIFKMIENTAGHYEIIVNRCIQCTIQMVIDRNKTMFRQLLDEIIQICISKAKTYRSPICGEEEVDADRVGEGRTSYFLRQLSTNLAGYHLHSDFSDAISALDAGTTICDSEPTNEWDSLQKELLNSLSCLSQNEINSAELQNGILENVLRDLSNKEKNNVIQLRCGEPCPLCEFPCKRPRGHTNDSLSMARLHDCDHQPAGLAGGHFTENSSPEVRGRLCHQSCSNHVQEHNHFQFQGLSRPYSEFSVIYPTWLQPTPLSTNSHDIRQYIFFHYQQELAQHYCLLPCANIPSSFDHDLQVLRNKTERLLSR